MAYNLSPLIFHGTSTKKIANNIIDKANQLLNSSIDFKFNVGDLSISYFKDNEILPIFKSSIRYKQIIFVNSLFGSDSIMETMLVLDASKRADCNNITLIAPYIGYSRQDKSDHRRSSIGAKAVADMLQAVGGNKLRRIITFDLHNPSIQGFYNVSMTNLSGNKLFLPYVMNLASKMDNLCVVAPDGGALNRNLGIAKRIDNCTFASIDKKRDKPNEIASMILRGDVMGKNVFIFDDMCDTGGTLIKATELLLDNGALSVRTFCTHGILSDGAIEKIENSRITEFITSDSIPHVIEYNESKKYSKLKVISCSNMISEVLCNIERERSIEDLNNL